MALSPRQRRFYQDRCDIWAPNFTIAPDSDPAADTWQRIATGVRFHLHQNPSTDDASVGGRFERDLIFTLDLGYFDGGQDIDADYIVKVTSLDIRGDPTENNGRYWKVRGHAKVYTAFRTRPHFGRKSVLMSNLPNAEVPEGVG